MAVQEGMRPMRARTIWILLAIVVLLGGYVYWFEVREESRTASTEESKDRARRVFPTLAEGDAKLVEKVTQVSIERKGAKLTVERKGKEWMITQPVEATAVKDSVEGLVRSILDMAKEPKDIKKADFTEKGLAEYGLEEPAVKVTITVDGQPHEVLFGKADPTGRVVYARLAESSDVMRVDKYVVDGLPRGAGDLRDRHFLHFESGALEWIRMKSAKAEVVLVRRDPDWELEFPVHDRADSIRSQDIVSKLGQLEAEDFIDEATAEKMAEMGLAPAQASVQLSSPAGGPAGETGKPEAEAASTESKRTLVTLLIGKAVAGRPDQVYVQVEGAPTVYKVGSELVKLVEHDAGYWRDGRLARFVPVEVKTLELKHPDGQDILMEKSGGKWTIRKPKEIEADLVTVEKMLEELSELSIIRYADDSPSDPAKYGLDPKEAWMVRVGLEGKPGQTFVVGKFDPVEKDVFVQRGGQPNVLAVQESFLKSAQAGFLDLRTRKVAEINRYEVNKLTVTADGKVSVLEKTANKWFMTQPVAAPAYEPVVTALLDELDNLRAEKLLAEKIDDPAKWGLDKPMATVVVEIKKPDQEPQVYQLEIGKKLTEGGYAARLSGNELLFTMGEPLVSNLKVEFHDRMIWDFRMEQVTRLTWTKSGVEVVVRREGGLWKLIRPEGQTLDENRLANLVSQVGTLAVERFLSYAKTDAAKFGLDKPSVVLTLTADGVEQTLTMGQPGKDGSAAAMVGDKEGVFMIDAGLAGLLNGGVARVEEKKTEEGAR